MFTLLTVVVTVVAQLVLAQHSHKYVPTLPGKAGPNECFDAEIDQVKKQGDTWAELNQGCKQSTCVKANGTMYIDRTSCDNIDKNALKAYLKETYGNTGDVFCREASGNRNKPFPGCCNSILCKRKDGNRLVTIPKEDYPEVPDTYEYA